MKPQRVIQCGTFACVWLLATSLPLGQTTQRPTFRAGAELIAIETQVVTKDGEPLAGLKAEDFDVLIDGQKRIVATLEFIRTVSSGASAIPESPSEVKRTPPDGRVFILGIDQTSFPMLGEPAAREAARRLIERMAPEDYLGLVAYPGPIAIPPTRDRAKLREALGKVQGLWTDAARTHSISAAEATAFQTLGADSSVMKSVVERECPPKAAGGALTGAANYGRDPACAQAVIDEAKELGSQLEFRAAQSIGGLLALVEAVGKVPGRKNLVIVSAGIPASTRPGGRPDVNSAIANVASRAEAANVNLYVLYMDVHFLGQFSGSRANFKIFDDIELFGRGLGMFAGAAGGAFYQVEVGADRIVDRLVKETTAYYLIGVTPTDKDRDGKEHFISVKVKKSGATVHNRRTVIIPKLSSGGS